MKEFLLRTASALFLIFLVVGITLLPPLPFLLALAILSSGAAFEMGRLLGAFPGYSFMGAANLFLVILSLYFYLPLETITALAIINGILFLFTTRRENLGKFPVNLAAAFLPAVILGFPLFHLFLIWEMGVKFLYLLIIIVSLADTAAYLIGTALGRHKIYPVASPKKSWEGFLAALAFAGVTGALGGKVLGFGWGWAVGLLTGLAAQLSDPFESLFKRAAGVKDSSNLIPGHGGLLDRIDSYIFAAPVFYYLLHWVSL